MAHTFAQMGILAKFSLFIGLLPAVMAVGYAAWPSESKLALMRPLSLASIFSGLAGFTIGAMNTIRVVVEQELGVPTALVGLMESLVPLFVAFGSLTMAWLLVAVGMRRQARA